MDENRQPLIMHETTDVDVWAIARFGIALVVLCVLSLGLLFGMFKFFQDRMNAHPGTRVMDPVKMFPQPQLQQTPVLDLETFRAGEDETLATYGWVDQQKGVVRIPIDRAIDLLAARGLPVRTEQPAVGKVSVPTESGGRE